MNRSLLEKQIVDAAEAMLRGEIGIVEGSRMMCGFHFRLSHDQHDRKFNAFIAIESETDCLPLGKFRELWAPDALARKDVEIREAENFYREQAFAACRVLISCFSHRPNEETNDLSSL